jgi:hypothetical protein
LALTDAGAVRASVMIYGIHLTLTAIINLLLWIEVRRGATAHGQVVRSCLVLTMFVAALAVDTMRPDLALYLQIAPPLARHLVRHLHKT